MIPFGPDGDMRYVMKSHDLETDRYMKTESVLASKDMIFMMDGTFLERVRCDKIPHLFLMPKLQLFYSRKHYFSFTSSVTS